MPRVLVVEDDEPIAEPLVRALRRDGHDARWARTGADALEAVRSESFDLVVLDLGLPDIDGIQVLQGIRGWSPVPVLVLSARSTSAEKVEALDAGADDYVTKPFGMDELLARHRPPHPGAHRPPRGARRHRRSRRRRG